VEIPIQFFQSIIAIELAVSGALLWQMRSALSGLLLYVAVVTGVLVLLDIE
jgi:hypothetical protein